MLKLNQKQFGFSIIEMLIGLAISAIVIGGTLLAYLSIVKSSKDHLLMLKLDHEMRTAMNLMVNDLRRARYWANAKNDVNTGSITNPFATNTTDLQISSNCVLFSYDYNKDGTLPALNTASSDERFGYRLSGNAVQTRPNTSGTFSCSDAQSSWVDITNPNIITVTGLTFTPTSDVIDVDGAGTGTTTVTMTTISVSMTARLSSDTSVQRTLTESVRVRNDKITP